VKTTLIAFKESAIIKPGCLRPHMTELLEVLLLVAPDTNDGIMWVTEGWRPQRHPNDAHTWCNAWDVRSKNVIVATPAGRGDIMDQWGEDARHEYGRGSPMQFDAHGMGAGLHLHAEYDPR
jgi:hypothetical protein